MLVDTFDFSLKHPCPKGLVVMAKFDGKHPAIASATTGGKVLIHQPYSGQSAENNNGDMGLPAIGKGQGKDGVKFLNTNKDIVAMAAGCIDRTKPGVDMLFIGSRTNLLAYDVDSNRDLFDKEVSDGVSCLAFGTHHHDGTPLIVAGGNCSITGFDQGAEERFWTVTGDNVAALTFMDWDDDGEDELVAGSDDFAIRVFKGEELIFDINEQSKIAFLKKIHRQIFGYALANGQGWGVYHGKKRLWRQKTKDHVTALIGVDFDLDGQMELVAGFASGAIEARKHRTGDVIHKTTMGASISQLFNYDYRMDGIPQVIAVDVEGEVKGLTVTRNVKQFLAASVEGGVEATEQKEAEQRVLELNQKKIELMNKLEQLKKRKEQRKQQAQEMKANGAASSQLSTPTKDDLRIQYEVDPNSASTLLNIVIAKPGWIIRSVIIYNEVLFQKESSDSYAVHPNQSTNQVTIPLRFDKNQELYLDLRVLVGTGINSNQFLVFNQPRFVFKKFSLLRYIPPEQKLMCEKPSSQVMYVVDEKLYTLQHIAAWADSVFILTPQQSTQLANMVNVQKQLQLRFMDARTSKALIITAQPSGAGLQVTIQTDQLELCGDLVQDLFGRQLRMTELDTEGSFPQEMRRLQEILSQMEQLNQIKSHFSANIAESINNLKVFIVKAEASLMISDLDNMKKSYAVVQQENGNLIGEYTKRANNHQQLVSTLKELNNMIRNASNLRLGAAQKRVVALARDCIKNNQFSKIGQVFEKGNLR